MSICPHCHQMDKNFFAPICHNCNNPVGFIEQCVHSLLYTVVLILSVIFFGWALIKMIGWAFSG
jgi:hypothetical protein